MIRPPSLFLHVGEDRLHRPEIGEEADSHGPLQLAGRFPFDSPHWGAGPGVVDQDVDTTEGVDSGSHRGVDLFLLAHIGFDKERPRAKSIEFAGCSLARVRVDLSHDDRGSLAGETFCDAPANALARAGNDRNLAL